jgi:hypothetical protein
LAAFIAIQLLSAATATPPGTFTTSMTPLIFPASVASKPSASPLKTGLRTA